MVCVLPSLGGGESDGSFRGVHHGYKLTGAGESALHHATGHVVANRPHPHPHGHEPEAAADAGETSLAPLSVLATASVVIATMQCSLVLANTSTFVMINNSCRRRDRGAANGIGQTCASLGRSCGPALVGTVFVWSQSQPRPWPFDYHFVFYMLAGLACGVLLLSRRLPSRINRKLYDD